ncbi:hypothetical protein [Falsiroseomonas sp. CW058]|uniref:hypothetical protein n=1 Tax=Falsiroseomonas sp. CW058 TaxID=3388664 RepID=UPI003D31AE1C
MPKYKSMDELATAHPMMAASPPVETYHRIFCFWCQELMGNEYACWAAVQQFKHAPSKRRAIFIVDTWLKQSDGSIGTSLNMSLLSPINPGSKESKFTISRRQDLLKRVEEIRSVKTWIGKLQHWSDRGARGAVGSDLMAGIEDVLRENFADVLAAKSLDTDKVIQGSAYYADSLRTDAPKLTAVTFDTRLMGLW